MLPFFVYGTLLPEQHNYVLWENAIEHSEAAILHGATLYDMGSFPMLVSATVPGASESVSGLVVSVQADLYAKTLQRLDQLEQYDPQFPERSAYRRVQRTVVTEGGVAVSAWVYIGNLRLSVGLPVIQSGDWVGYSAEKMVNIRNWWQNVTNTPFFPAS